MQMLGGRDPFLQGNRIWLPYASSPAMVPWTLEDIPAEYRANGGLWDPVNAAASDGFVEAVFDPWSNNNMRQTVGSQRPAYGMLQGMPAIIFPDAVNNCFLIADNAFAPAWWQFVMQYRDGSPLLWGQNGFPAIISSPVGNTRVMGSRIDTDALHDSSVWTSQSSNNGQPYSTKTLPLAKSLLAMRGLPTEAQHGIGRGSGSTERAWRGPFWMALALGIEPTGDLLWRIEGRLAWDFGIQEKLPANHPYRSAPPMKAA